MLRRFASACLVASVLVALAATALLLATGATVKPFAFVVSVWCLVPCVWGIWAMIIPQSWTPQHFPLWGAILGVIAGFFAAFVLDLPARILGTPVSIALRSAGYVVMVAFYYVAWHFVRIAYNKLEMTTDKKTPKSMVRAA